MAGGRAHRRLWILNLDAELEVEGLRPYGGPFAALQRRPDFEAMTNGLVPAGDVVLRGAEQRGELAGHPGRAWCPTASALRELEAQGAIVGAAPSMQALRRVMSRRFHAELGLLLPSSSFSTDAAEERIEARSPSGAWLGRRAFGFAGRARRIIGYPPKPADRLFATKAAREGGLLLEPYVLVSADFALHGFIDGGGSVELGRPTCALVDRGGVWRGSRLALEQDLRAVERTSLFAEATRAARALYEAGYRGPFGVDAFRFRLREGDVDAFCARCEINARYSMGWGIGMAERRADLDEERISPI